jgi:hypothetical protein
MIVASEPVKKAPRITSRSGIVPAVTIPQLHLDTFGSKESRIMAEDITLDEKFRRLDAALDELQRTVEAGGVVPDEIFNEFLTAAEEYRQDPEYRAAVGLRQRLMIEPS